jgi:cold shock CspA family protein
MIGQVVFFKKDKAFGFIQPLVSDPRQSDYFFHIKAVMGHLYLETGDIVEFDENDKPYRPERLEAMNVRLIKKNTEVVPSTIQEAR